MSAGNFRLFILPFYIGYYQIKDKIVKEEQERFDDLTTAIFSYIIGKGAIKEDTLEVLSEPLKPYLIEFQDLIGKYLPDFQFNIYEVYRDQA